MLCVVKCIFTFISINFFLCEQLSESVKPKIGFHRILSDCLIDELNDKFWQWIYELDSKSRNNNELKVLRILRQSLDWKFLKSKILKCVAVDLDIGSEDRCFCVLHSFINGTNQQILWKSLWLEVKENIYMKIIFEKKQQFRMVYLLISGSRKFLTFMLKYPAYQSSSYTSQF